MIYQTPLLDKIISTCTIIKKKILINPTKDYPLMSREEKSAIRKIHRMGQKFTIRRIRFAAYDMEEYWIGPIYYTYRTKAEIKIIETIFECRVWNIQSHPQEKIFITTPNYYFGMTGFYKHLLDMHYIKTNFKYERSTWVPRTEFYNLILKKLETRDSFILY